MQGDAVKRWLGVGAVAVIALAILLLRGSQSGPSRHTPRTEVQVVGKARSVLLVADLGEAEEACGCGEIIRMVRHAEMHGIHVREVAPGTEPDLERHYRIAVAPTVLFLDKSGRELARHEGESPAVVDSIRSGLERLPADAP